MNGFDRQSITNPCNRKTRIWCIYSSKGWKQTVDLMKSGDVQSSNRGRPHCSGWNSRSECSIESAMEYESDSFWSDGTATTFILAAFPALTPTLLKTRRRRNSVNWYQAWGVGLRLFFVLWKNLHGVFDHKTTWSIHSHSFCSFQKPEQQQYYFHNKHIA